MFILQKITQVKDKYKHIARTVSHHRNHTRKVFEVAMINSVSFLLKCIKQYYSIIFLTIINYNICM